jgi:hypothetical protein
MKITKNQRIISLQFRFFNFYFEIITTTVNETNPKRNTRIDYQTIAGN